jgi:purine-nucleoside phosphorylase
MVHFFIERLQLASLDVAPDCEGEPIAHRRVEPVRRFEASRLPSSAAKEAASWVNEQCNTRIRPKIGIILGSGLNDLLSTVDVKQRFSFADIPYFSAPTVTGHLGQLEMGYSQGQSVAILRGRFHFYEGHSPDRLALPVRVLRELGVDTLVVTNAAGGLNPEFRQGDLMLMRDHIGLPTLAGYNPLIGPNDDDLGPRFPPMGAAYDPELLTFIREIAQQSQLRLKEGVYIMVSGPTYETPAEMRALRTLGADAVGMSTVPEVIAARHAGMRVLGISCITNSATPETATSVNHDEVLIGAAATLPKLDRLLKDFLAGMASKNHVTPDIIGEHHHIPAITHKRADERSSADVAEITPIPLMSARAASSLRKADKF